jgi:hypothetical protein
VAKDLKSALEDVLESAEELRAAEERAGALLAAAQPFLDEEAARLQITLSDEPLTYIRQHIEMAIQIGAAAYNSGDHRGCYEAYACTARLMLRTVVGATEAKGRLQRALSHCQGLTDPNQQAWAMRHGFDDVLTGAFGAPIVAGDAVRNYVSSAIQIGARAYDGGDPRGCYEVYACTARMILNTVQGEEAVKQALSAALVECAPLSDVREQSLVLRRAFDRILAGAEAE